MKVKLSLNFRYKHQLFVAENFSLLLPCKKQKQGTRYEVQCPDYEIIMYLNNAFLVAQIDKIYQAIHSFYNAEYRYGSHKGRIKDTVLWPPELYSLTISGEGVEGLRLVVALRPTGCKSEYGTLYCGNTTISVNKDVVEVNAALEDASKLFKMLTGVDYFTWLKSVKLR